MSAILQGACPYCGSYHSTMCSRIKSVEYGDYGEVRRIEFHPDPVVTVEPAVQLESCVQIGDDYFWNGSKIPRNAVGRCKGCDHYRGQGHAVECEYNFVDGYSKP